MRPAPASQTVLQSSTEPKTDICIVTDDKHCYWILRLGLCDCVPPHIAAQPNYQYPLQLGRSRPSPPFLAVWGCEWLKGFRSSIIDRISFLRVFYFGVTKTTHKHTQHRNETGRKKSTFYIISRKNVALLYLCISLRSNDVIKTLLKTPFCCILDLRVNNILDNNFDEFKRIIAICGRRHYESDVQLLHYW